MLAQFQIEIANFKTLKLLPNSWNNEDYKALLEVLDYGNISEIPDSELEESCLLYLSDNEPEDAAKVVLTYVFKGALNSGQIDNASNEMLEEKLWEEYADLSMHERFFNVGQLLFKAYNGTFPLPEAVQFNVSITSKQPKALTYVKDQGESALLLLLVQGMPDNTVLKRLYKQQLKDGDIEDAENILWQLNNTVLEGSTLKATIISSQYWFHDLKYVKDFDAKLTIEE